MIVGYAGVSSGNTSRGLFTHNGTSVNGMDEKWTMLIDDPNTYDSTLRNPASSLKWPIKYCSKKSMQRLVCAVSRTLESRVIVGPL